MTCFMFFLCAQNTCLLLKKKKTFSYIKVHENNEYNFEKQELGNKGDPDIIKKSCLLRNVWTEVHIYNLVG